LEESLVASLFLQAGGDLLCLRGAQKVSSPKDRSSYLISLSLSLSLSFFFSLYSQISLHIDQNEILSSDNLEKLY
jgi:hypothetical protein